jgi:hypothetical protein
METKERIPAKYLDKEKKFPNNNGPEHVPIVCELRVFEPQPSKYALVLNWLYEITTCVSVILISGREGQLAGETPDEVTAIEMILLSTKMS